jgi:hypothetical protein
MPLPFYKLQDCERVVQRAKLLFGRVKQRERFDRTLAIFSMCHDIGAGVRSEGGPGRSVHLRGFPAVQVRTCVARFDR